MDFEVFGLAEPKSRPRGRGWGSPLLLKASSGAIAAPISSLVALGSHSTSRPSWMMVPGAGVPSKHWLNIAERMCWASVGLLPPLVLQKIAIASLAFAEQVPGQRTIVPFLLPVMHS